MSWAVLNPGESFPSFGFNSQVPRRLWLQCGCQLEVVPGLSYSARRFYAFIFPTGCHHVISCSFDVFGLRHGILRLPEEHSCRDWGEMGLSAGSAGVDKASWSARPDGAAPCLLFPARVWTEHLADGRRQSKICQKEGKEREKEQSTPASLRWWRSVRARRSWSILIYVKPWCEQCGPLWSAMCSEQFIGILQLAAVSKVVSTLVGKTRPIHIIL